MTTAKTICAFRISKRELTRIKSVARSMGITLTALIVSGIHAVAPKGKGKA